MTRPLLEEVEDDLVKFLCRVGECRRRWTHHENGVRSLSFEELDRLARARDQMNEFLTERAERMGAMALLVVATLRHFPLEDPPERDSLVMEAFANGWNDAFDWILTTVESEWRKLDGP